MPGPVQDPSHFASGVSPGILWVLNLGPEWGLSVSTTKRSVSCREIGLPQQSHVRGDKERSQGRAHPARHLYPLPTLCKQESQQKGAAGQSQRAVGTGSGREALLRGSMAPPLGL